MNKCPIRGDYMNFKFIYNSLGYPIGIWYCTCGYKE